MVNRKRPIILRCPVTAEERSLIEQKMSQLQTKRIGAYLRKMAIDGYIIYVDTKDIKEMNKLLSAIGRNINQIAKRVNAGGPTYQADMEEIRERLDQIWQLQRRILLNKRRLHIPPRPVCCSQCCTKGCDRFFRISCPAPVWLARNAQKITQ